MSLWSKTKLFCAENWKILVASIVAIFGALFVLQRERSIKEVALGALDDVKTVEKINEEKSEKIIAGIKKSTEEFSVKEARIIEESKKDEADIKKREVAEEKKLKIAEKEKPGTIAKELANEFGATYVETKTKN